MLTDKIEKLRCDLNESLKDCNFINNDILKKSEELDSLIVEHYKKTSKIKELEKYSPLRKAL